MGKEERVHDLVVLLGEDLVEASTQFLLRLLRLVGPDAPDDGVHGMVGAARVDGDPADPAIQHPLGELAARTRMADEVRRLVDA